MDDPQPGPAAQRTPALADQEDLVGRAIAGDQAAFGRLVEHYQSACYGLAWRLLGDADLAADATQDAFLHAYSAISRYRGGIFRSWLLRITANASYDVLRRAQRRPTTSLSDPVEGGELDLPDHAADPARSATQSEMFRRLEIALRALPEDQRTAIVLCDVYGMDYGDVAVTTRAALGTVKSRLHRGRLRLRELLAEHRELFTG
ncbi:MAG: sigma-70 family RNA polymerase sigma factor [Chloroflexota bacterium]|nr:sigma-70 family RNA polymerase sigma factor [Chloroflexota bacterium]